VLTRVRVLKANLSWSPTLGKFYQLIASLSILTKLKLEYFKYGYAKKKDKHTNEKFLQHSCSTFFEFSSSLLLEPSNALVYTWRTFTG